MSEPIIPCGFNCLVLCENIESDCVVFMCHVTTCKQNQSINYYGSYGHVEKGNVVECGVGVVRFMMV